MEQKGKIVVVTGASRGLGKALAIGLAGAGHSIAVVARTGVETPALEGTVYDTTEEIRRLNGTAKAFVCDVSDERQVQKTVSRILEHFGRIDVLVNNAGIARPAPIWDLSLKNWNLVIKVNLTGTFLCSRAVLPGMMARGAGSIINISSIQAGLKASVKSGTVYGVTKAALERLTLGMAEELRSYNISVNCLKPRGAVRTEGMIRLYPDADQSSWDDAGMMVKACTFL
ncbi:MAG TPA: SDR family oxidoreductase, partial [Syntrophorhabdaceae bacterium]|nr:SDR family oxidoreductase [Syntrophorhabdaceae bacterium]